ncbi:MAG TPA: hypothetical protein VLB79_07400 [Solirubrobacterales bacterium]|nr:hypothetical protein [Solirubrobacterales bacterium]
MTRIRVSVALALALISALLLGACGGSGGNNEDPQQVLTETFSNPTSIKSGNFDLDFKIETNGGASPGTFEVKLGGQFQSQAANQFPQVDFDVSLRAESGSQTISGSGGLTSTGTRGFVNIQGTEYSVPQQLYDRFTSTYSQLQSQGGSNPRTGLLQRLNIDPARWLTDLKNEGTEDVEGQQTIHISGKANVPEIVDDLKTIAEDAGRSVGNVDVSRLDQLNDTIQSGEVDVNTGETDKLLRRVGLEFNLKPPPGTPGAPDSLDVHLQLNLADVNQPQAIQAPANAQPLDESALRGLGIDPSSLGGALRGGLGPGGPLPESGGSTAAPTQSATQAYQQCLSRASGVEALQRCAQLLGQ